jgi:hypothetical protein
MKKRNIIIFIVCTIVAVGVYFGLQKKRQVVISNQELGTSNQEVVMNEQDAVDSPQEAINNEQQKADSDKETITKVQETSNIQNSKDNKQDADIRSSVISDQSSRLDAEEKISSVGKIVSRLVSWGFQKATGRKIDTLVIHTSYNAIGGDEFDKEQVIQEWKDAGVAPHYMIARDGTIYQLVADQNIAWHAGVAKMPDGRTDVNSFSIGIEVINTKEGKFASAQYDALNRLISDLKQKYTIKYILGHSEIAPGRKTDPWGIDWSKVSR